MAKQEQSAGVQTRREGLAGRIATSRQAEIDTMNTILARL